jgi:hypothetical protein
MCQLLGLRAIALIVITIGVTGCYDFSIGGAAGGQDGSAAEPVNGSGDLDQLDTSRDPMSGDPNGLTNNNTPPVDVQGVAGISGGDTAGQSGADHGGGAGVSGQGDTETACEVGSTRCDKKGLPLVEVCTITGIWKETEECGSVCLDGACVGVCTPGKKHCGVDQIPETCNSKGEWIPAQNPCRFVCSGRGECAGECSPGTKRCGGTKKLTPETCDENGIWVSFGSECLNICSNGSCGGTCSPGALQCGANETPEKCSDKGTWESQKACDFVCSENGQCTGGCKPGSKSCSGQKRLSCDQTGEWAEGSECVDSACSNGLCIGACTPGELQCGSNETPQKCDTSGKWIAQSKCPFVCNTGGICGGSCTPKSKICSGTTLRTCLADGSGYTDEVCQPANKGETAACSNTACQSSCVSPAQTCPDSRYPKYCWNLEYGCDQCINGTVFRSATKPVGCIDYVCVTPQSRSARQSENANPHYSNGACEAGYVPRGANQCDNTVCVTQTVHDQIIAENAAAYNNKHVNSGATP